MYRNPEFLDSDEPKDAVPEEKSDAEVFEMLCPSLKEKLRHAGVVGFFPIQRVAVPVAVLECEQQIGIGRDICVSVRADRPRRALPNP